MKLEEAKTCVVGGGKYLDILGLSAHFPRLHVTEFSVAAKANVFTIENKFQQSILPDMRASIFEDAPACMPWMMGIVETTGRSRIAWPEYV